jgi:RNAse P Rpr2/Rpp21/SNM1 subunit domain
MEYHHLSRIAAEYPNKAVSRFAIYKIRKSLIEQGLANDQEIVGSLLICRKCSQRLMPGVNCEVSIERARKQYRNSAVYFCKLCLIKTRFNGVHRRPNKYDKIKKNPQLMPNNNTKSTKDTATEKLETFNYQNTGFRTLNKDQKKKTLLESFFESTSNTSLYKIFH